MKVSIRTLEEETKAPYGLKLPAYVEQAYMHGLIHGESQVDVPDTFFKDVAEARCAYDDEQAEREARRSEEAEVSKHRLSGMGKEKNADNEGAISEYAVAIILGEQSKYNLFHAYAHAYERIIVCLHKAKKFDKESDYIERYLKYNLSEAARSKYSVRLEKLKTQTHGI